MSPLTLEVITAIDRVSRTRVLCRSVAVMGNPSVISQRTPTLKLGPPRRASFAEVVDSPAALVVVLWATCLLAFVSALPLQLCLLAWCSSAPRAHANHRAQWFIGSTALGVARRVCADAVSPRSNDVVGDSWMVYPLTCWDAIHTHHVGNGNSLKGHCKGTYCAVLVFAGLLPAKGLPTAYVAPHVV